MIHSHSLITATKRAPQLILSLTYPSLLTDLICTVKLPRQDRPVRATRIVVLRASQVEYVCQGGVCVTLPTYHPDLVPPSETLPETHMVKL